MTTTLLGLLAETPIHPGSGRSTGVVDLPVAREAATDYPVLVGSSLKGALRDRAEGVEQDADRYFGKPDQAGALLVSDGRLLLLPVRSLTGSYRWATCPHLIERLGRDLARAGHPWKPLAQSPARGAALADGENRGGKNADGKNRLFLEERQFDIEGPPPEGLTDAIRPLLLHRETQERLAAQIAILHDDDFAWFARYGLAIQARNVLEDGTKRSTNLWYEETLPPDTIMYALVAARGDFDPDEVLHSLFPGNDSYLQAGGNETVGQGWFAVSIYGGNGNGEGAAS